MALRRLRQHSAKGIHAPPHVHRVIGRNATSGPRGSSATDPRRNRCMTSQQAPQQGHRNAHDEMRRNIQDRNCEGGACRGSGKERWQDLSARLDSEEGVAPDVVCGSSTDRGTQQPIGKRQVLSSTRRQGTPAQGDSGRAATSHLLLTLRRRFVVAQ